MSMWTEYLTTRADLHVPFSLDEMMAACKKMEEMVKKFPITPEFELVVSEYLPTTFKSREPDGKIVDRELLGVMMPSSRYRLFQNWYDGTLFDQNKPMVIYLAGDIILDYQILAPKRRIR